MDCFQRYEQKSCQSANIIVLLRNMRNEDYTRFNFIQIKQWLDDVIIFVIFYLINWPNRLSWNLPRQ